MRASTVTIKTEQDLEKLRISGRLAASVLEMIGKYVKPGVTTEYLDDICNDYIVNTLKVIPANVGYYGYTKTTCISPNEVVCHGIPSGSTVLKDGDIINIDVAIIKDGYFGDTSRMYYVGNVSPEARKLCETTYEAMVAGIHTVKPGATTWVILDMRSRKLLSAKVTVSCVNIVGMELVRCIMSSRIFCTTDSQVQAWFLKKEWSLPLSRWSMPENFMLKS